MRRHLIAAAIALVFAAGSAAAAPPDLPAALWTDPPHDAAHPARMAVLHVPSGGVKLNAVAYLAAGPGPHPTALLCHGLPGNEKNLDLAQALRRAGWNAVTFNYRGSWGSPGVFRFVQNPDDAAAVLAWLEAPAHAAELGIDARRIVVIGHSMGGWVAVRTAAAHPELAGLVTISAADMAHAAQSGEADRTTLMADNMEALAGVTAASMAQDVLTVAKASFADAAPHLTALPYLALTADDGLAPDTQALVSAIQAAGGRRASLVHQATDHGWNDARIALEAHVIAWLQSLD